MNKQHTSRAALLGAATAAALLTASLAGCNKPVDEVKDEATQAAGQAQDKINDAAKATAEAVSDAAIVTRINAAIVADDKLKVLKIDVSSADGLVKLTGTAPDADSRQRATALAAAVSGVRSVDNQMVVSRNG